MRINSETKYGLVSVTGRLAAYVRDTKMELAEEAGALGRRQQDVGNFALSC